MTTRMLLRGISLFIWLIGFCLDCSSKPLDSGTAERLQELAELSAVIDGSQPLSDEQWAVIEKSLGASDDVSVAVTTLFLQRINNDRARALLLKIGASDVQRGLLTDAVLKNGRLTSELENAVPDNRASRWREMATDTNPYARIAAAKALCAVDPNAAKAVLISIEKEKSEISPVANRIRRELAAHLGEEPPPPIPGFETLYTWFERSAGSLASAQFSDGKSSRLGAEPQVPSPPTSHLPSPSTPKQVLELMPASTLHEEPASSTPWSIIVVLIVAATGLLWLMLKRRS